MRIRRGLSEVARPTCLTVEKNKSEIRGLCDAMLVGSFVCKREPKHFGQ